MTIFPKQFWILRQNTFVLPLIFILVRGWFVCHAENAPAAYPYWKLEPLPNNFYRVLISLSANECLVGTQYFSPTIPVQNPTMRVERVASHFSIYIQLSPIAEAKTYQYNSQSDTHPHLPMWATVNPNSVEKSGSLPPIADLATSEAPDAQSPSASESEQSAQLANSVASTGSNATLLFSTPAISSAITPASGATANTSKDKSEKAVVGSVEASSNDNIYGYFNKFPEKHFWWAAVFAAALANIISDKFKQKRKSA
jgi:hypothetical protein